MIEHEDSTCSMELDPNQRPNVTLDPDISQLNNSFLNFLDSSDILSMNSGIEATDVGSLLEQFEEASNSIDNYDLLRPTSPVKVTDFDFGGTNKSDENEVSSGRSTPTENVLSKIRSSKKRKSTILLPMGMPSKRGRGRAVAMPTNCAPPKLKKMMPQISVMVDQEAAKAVEQYVLPAKDSVVDRGCTSKQIMNEEKVELNHNYYSNIMDHDYCINVPKVTGSDDVSSVSDMSKNDKSLDPPYPEEDILDLEDGEVIDMDESDKENSEKQEVSKSNSSFLSDKLRQAHSRRNYRKRDESPEASDSDKYFDKIPSYYTALSVKMSKPPKKDKETSRAGINVQDYFEPNPAPTQDSSVYSKLPDYYSCFTNSTKYDNSDELDKDLSLDNSQDSKGSSGYSSRCQSPLVIHIQGHRSRSDSRSPDRRRRGRSHRRSRRRSYDSLSSRSRSRSSSSYSSRSRSRSSSYDYSSRSRSRSRSHSRSRSSSRRERGERSASFERQLQERKRQREEEKAQQIEERRIVYVGKIPNDYTRRQLRKRFGRFGEIEEVSVHFREHADNYGFVTFAYTCDAYAAVEKGNAIPGEEVFDLCFGGRRQFCEVEYADLDGNNEIEEEYYPLTKKQDTMDFDELLRQARQKTVNKK